MKVYIYIYVYIYVGEIYVRVFFKGSKVYLKLYTEILIVFVN